MKFLDTAAVAKMLDCSTQHVRNLIAAGVLTNRGSPRQVLVHRSEVEAALARGDIAPRPRATRWTAHYRT